MCRVRHRLILRWLRNTRRSGLKVDVQSIQAQFASAGNDDLPAKVAWAHDSEHVHVVDCILLPNLMCQNPARHQTAQGRQAVAVHLASPRTCLDYTQVLRLDLLMGRLGEEPTIAMAANSADQAEMCWPTGSEREE